MANLTLGLLRCRNCGTELDTRFLTHCPECGTPAGTGEDEPPTRVETIPSRMTPWPTHLGRWVAAAGVGAVLVVAGALITGPSVPRGDDGRVTTPVQADVSAVTVGDCVNLPTDPGGAVITTVEIVPCLLPHQVQKYSDVEHPAGAVGWIGADAVERWAAGACADDFEVALGMPYGQADELDFYFVYPAPDAWVKGDRIVQCFVMRADRVPLVGTVGQPISG